MPGYHKIITSGVILRERKNLMKNKKLFVISAVMMAVVLAGSSLAIFAAETAVPTVEAAEDEPELTVPVADETETETAVPNEEAETEAAVSNEEAAVETAAPTVEAVEDEPELTAPATDEPEPAALIAEETSAEPAASDVNVDDTDYSYHVGQQSSIARNDAYGALPEGGTKEEAEEFYETYEVGGGAWTDGTYDESLKSGYGYAEGQLRAAQYAQDGDDDEAYKAGYSYSTGRQSYMENYPNYTK